MAIIPRTSASRRPPTPSVAHLESLISLAFPAPPTDGLTSTESAVSRLTGELREALRYAVVRADMGLLGWLIGLQGQTAAILDAQANLLTDVDGNRLISIAIIASAGVDSSSAAGPGIMQGDDGSSDTGVVDQEERLASGKKMEDREEIVRILVRRWGILGGDTAWQPLHLAALLASPPLVSFLLTQGASPHATTLKGLTPYDLISDMTLNHRQDVAALLHGAMQGELEDRSMEGDNDESATVTPARWETSSFGGEIKDDTGTGLSARRQRMLERHRRNKVKRAETLARREEKRLMAEEKNMWVTSMVAAIELGDSIEFLMSGCERRRDEPVGGLSLDEGESETETEDDEEEDEEEETEGGFERLQRSDPFEEMETEETSRLPLETPPDIDDASFLVWTMDQVETSTDIFVRSLTPHCFPLNRRTMPANAIYLFAKFAIHRCDTTWLTTILEEMTASIEQTCATRSGDLPYLAFWTYNVTILLHLIQSDPMMLDACENENLCLMLEEMLNALQVHVIRLAETKIDRMLDGALLDHETIETLGDVRFDDEWAIFRGLSSKRKAVTAVTAASDASRIGGSPPSMKGSVDLSRPHSLSDMKNGSTRSIQRLTTGGLRPQDVVEVLSATLVVLQLYEVNPALAVQVFSQIFLWIASEIFNRIIAQGKKYLCRSKAMQIKMNISVLEDWARMSGLPPAIYTCHFERVQNLLQWLQCSSQLDDFDMLIATMQNMHSINPLQMRRAAKDYRFEVNERRMSEECSQYLLQLQRDWERRRIRLGVEAIQRQVNMRKLGEVADESPQGTLIDELFDPEMGLSEYRPPIAPPSIGELEDSKHMLPLFLPSNRFLSAIPSTNVGSTGGERSPSRSSSQRPLGWTLRTSKKLRELPDGFIKWLQAAHEARLRPQHIPDRPILAAQGKGTAFAATKPSLTISPSPMQTSSTANIMTRMDPERSRTQSDPSRQDADMTSPRMPLSAPPYVRHRADSSSPRKSLRRAEGSPASATTPRWWGRRARGSEDGDGGTPTGGGTRLWDDK